MPKNHGGYPLGKRSGVWIATSKDVDGLVVEAETWPGMIEKIELIVPDLLEVMSTMDGRMSDVS
jgi:Domain of unknown function (DUF1902)